MAIDPDEINWHDGVLCDLRISGLDDEQQQLTFLLDLYPDTKMRSQRRRYRCVASGLRRILLNGDIGRLVKNAKSGNVDLMRMDFTVDCEIPVVSLFGGGIEAEATTFTLTEVTS